MEGKYFLICVVLRPAVGNYASRMPCRPVRPSASRRRSALRLRLSGIQNFNIIIIISAPEGVVAHCFAACTNLTFCLRAMQLR